jgi:hypothetical protein
VRARRRYLLVCTHRVDGRVRRARAGSRRPADRLLPGRNDAGKAICRDCAGITRNFFCNRCGFEGHLHIGRLCTRCTVSDQLHQVLDDGTGRIHPPLKSLVDALVNMPNPRNAWFWLRSLVGDLATGRLPLTHDALHELPNWRTVAYLRDLLMQCWILPTVDKQLLHFETWLRQRLSEHRADDDHRLLRQFGLWHQLPKLRSQAQHRPLTPATRHFAAEQLTHAAGFLLWLDEHGRVYPDRAGVDRGGDAHMIITWLSGWTRPSQRASQAR